VGWLVWKLAALNGIAGIILFGKSKRKYKVVMDASNFWLIIIYLLRARSICDSNVLAAAFIFFKRQITFIRMQ